MHLYTKEEAVVRINALASAGKPFVFLINYALTGAYVEEPEAIAETEMLYNLNGATNAVPLLPLATPLEWETNPIHYIMYARSFACVKQHIHAGNSFLTNLTCATPVRVNYTTEQLFHHAQAKYKLWLKGHFVVFSPEIFIRIADRRITSYPMKGTLDASLPDARRQLLDNPKEAAEHATITDLIRNDLSRVASDVTVTRYRYLDELQTNTGRLLQASSEISGILPPDYLSNLGNILFTLLPAGSVTGAPKCKTIAIIAEAETHARGFYTGVMGYFDGKNLDSAVLIRYIEETAGGLVFKSGGGITAQSTPESEYEEMKQKVYVPIY